MISILKRITFLVGLIFYMHVILAVEDTQNQTSTTSTTTTTVAPPVNLKNLSKEAYTTDLINNRLVPADYNKNVRPNFGSNATVIDVSLNINDLSSISENSMVSWN